MRDEQDVCEDDETHSSGDDGKESEKVTLKN